MRKHRSFISLSHPDSQVNENFRGVSPFEMHPSVYQMNRGAISFKQWLGRVSWKMGTRGHLQPVLRAKPAGRFCHSVSLCGQCAGQELVWKQLSRIIWGCCRSKEKLVDETVDGCTAWPRMVLMPKAQLLYPLVPNQISETEFWVK